MNEARHQLSGFPAHNLKVIGSNPIPATTDTDSRSESCGSVAFPGLFNGLCFDPAEDRAQFTMQGGVNFAAVRARAQAGTYSAVHHYLLSIAAAGTDEARAVMAKMREIPVNDFYATNGRVREDGRMVHDMYFAQVKTPSDSTKPWDYYDILRVIPGNQAFRPAAESGCPLVGH